MKVYMDRRGCNVWDAACESDLSWHIDHGTYCTACTLGVLKDDSEDVTLVITDKDGSEKVLVVTDKNKWEIMDSWMLFLEKINREEKDVKV
ncbi:MAG: hypothetical protein FVQ83_12205 [Chloroflexi bacterium]|nr:hypothetical protein [Chloroflexota bacterium]